MLIYLSGTYSRPYLMNIYLAGEHTVKNGRLADWQNSIYILESYYYARENKYMHTLIPQLSPDNFLLDSGAFTFMSGAQTVDWNSYVDQYADFINHFGVTQFFELDIDVVVGLKKVESLRKRLERKTQKQCIPVWHKARGLDYWKGMIADYPYVSIGGIVSKEIKRTEYRYFHNLLAMSGDTKVHGLGFTNLKGILEYKFDSVDSTSWLYGNRSGVVYRFNGHTIEKVDKPEGTMLNSKVVAQHNFNEWIKFQQYAKLHL